MKTQSQLYKFQEEEGMSALENYKWVLTVTGQHHRRRATWPVLGHGRHSAQHQEIPHVVVSVSAECA